MTSFADIGAALDNLPEDQPAEHVANALVDLAEAVLENWVTARDMIPTQDTREGFRLLALHRQGAKGEPSFNACRETCREVAYHYNLVMMETGHPDIRKRLELMEMLVRHLFLFVGGKMEESQLGDFCCSSRPLRGAEEKIKRGNFGG